jgi:hypothetical protein
MPQPNSTITWRNVESSNIKRIGWGRTGMMVQFHSGSYYLYKGVSRQRAVACAYARSVGHYLNTRIKPNFTARKIRIPS